MQVIVKLTTKCNLGCVYCSEGDKCQMDLSLNTLYKLIDELPLLLDKYHDKNISLLWHGGEPLVIGKSYLIKAMQYASEKLQKYDLSFAMQTNGTLIDEEWITIFKQFNVGIGISLDGYKEIHDKNRLTKNHQPTFDLVLNNIKLLKQHGISAGTLMVLNTAEKIDVDKLFDFLKDNNLQPKIHPVIPCGRAKDEPAEQIDMIYKNYIELMKTLYQKVMTSDTKFIIEPLDSLMNTILGISSVRECSFNGNCGKNFICLYANGDVGFCGRDGSLDKDRYMYGNINDNSLISLYESLNAQKIRQRQEYLKQNDCKNCPDWKFCHGGCSFEAVNFYGTLNAKYPHCKLRRELLAYLKTTGLELLKASLLRQKRQYRLSIKSKKELLKEFDNGRE